MEPEHIYPEDLGITGRLKIVGMILAIIAGVAGVVVGLSFLLVWVFEPGPWSPPEPPSDAQMIRSLQNNRQDFDELLLFARSLDHDWVSGEPMPSVFATQGDDEKVRQLVEHYRVETIRQTEDGIEFTIYTVGMFSGSAKGYRYSTNPPTPLVENTENARPVGRVSEVYRRIEGNWYIWLYRKM